MFLKKVVCKIQMLALTLALGACNFVEVQDYIHEPTQELRQSIIYSGHQELESIDNRHFVIVPNFRTFAPSYSTNQANLIIVSKDSTTINVSKASLHNKETGFTENININKTYKVSENVSDTGYYLGFVPLFNESYEGFSKFNQAKELELIITYSISGGLQATEIIILDLITGKKVAWAT